MIISDDSSPFYRYRQGLETCPQAKTSKSGHAIFFSFFRRVRATSMTQRRVENTRVHFWTFSPVSVNLSTNKFLSIASCLIPQMPLGPSISNLKVQILLNYAATIRSQHFWARTAKWSAESLPRPAVVVENEKFFRITVIFS